MKNSTHSTNKSLPAALLFLAVLFLGNIAQAQGFLKTYTSPIIYNRAAPMLRNQIYESQDGYTVLSHLARYYAPNDSLKHFSIRHTDLKGVETQDFKLFDLVAGDYKFAGMNQTTIVLGEALDSSHICGNMT
jgi:hypothetical protein